MFKNNRCIDSSFPTQAMPYQAKEMKEQTMKTETQCCESYPGVMCPPVYECPQERVCHREINHQVRHICPVNTRIVNHHIYHHSYDPCFTCCEENVVCNVYDNKCCY